MTLHFSLRFVHNSKQVGCYSFPSPARTSVGTGESNDIVLIVTHAEGSGCGSDNGNTLSVELVQYELNLYGRAGGLRYIFRTRFLALVRRADLEPRASPELLKFLFPEKRKPRRIRMSTGDS